MRTVESPKIGHRRPMAKRNLVSVLLQKSSDLLEKKRVEFLMSTKEFGRV
jgi:hypothetical protein